MKPFRILSLAGGGARGLFQAHYLKHFSDHSTSPLHSRFDLVAGTSVGAINGLIVALQIPPSTAVTLFQAILAPLFRPKLNKLGFQKFIFSGSIYKQSILRNALEPILADTKLSDCKVPFLAPVATLAGFRAKIFSSQSIEPAERDVLAIDAVLSSAAAPTYFDPVEISSLNQAFLDGGVWANSPTLAAIMYAHTELNVPLQAIRVLSVGTGLFPPGATSQIFRRLRPISKTAVAAVFDLMFSSQLSFSDETTKAFIGENNLIQVDCQLQKNIALDDARSALEVLPGLAKEKWDETHKKVTAMFPSISQKYDGVYKTLELATVEMLSAAGLSKIIPARRYYGHFREGAGSITEYLDQARHSIAMVSINLRAGVGMESIERLFRAKLSKNDSFEIAISLLNPEVPSLLASINRSVNTDEQILEAEIRATLDHLLSFRESLPVQLRERLDLRVHNSVPFASAIIIDHDTSNARIQLETKAYREPIASSFAFEVVPGCEKILYGSLYSGFESLMKDGRTLVADARLAKGKER